MNMDHKKNYKLCPHCDGQIDLDVIACPYCGNDVSSVDQEEEEQYYTSYNDRFNQSLSPKETLASLYPPPYQPKVFDHSQEGSQEEFKENYQEEKAIENNKEIRFFPVFLLSLGVTFLGFSLLLFFFSKNGTLTLSFNGKLWPVFVFISVLSMYAGLRFFNKNHSE